MPGRYSEEQAAFLAEKLLDAVGEVEYSLRPIEIKLRLAKSRHSFEGDKIPLEAVSDYVDDMIRLKVLTTQAGLTYTVD